MVNRPLPAAWWCLLALLACGGAHAQVRRCHNADGGTLYTDRRCEDVGSTELRPSAGSDHADGFYRPGCARNVQALIGELGAAIDSGDANRIANVYHWTGMSSSAGYAIMGRLDVIAKRPLLDIRAVPPEAPGELADPAGFTVMDADTVPDAGAANASPTTAKPRPPVALRVEQTLANGSSPSRTVFALRRYLGCWWVSL